MRRLRLADGDQVLLSLPPRHRWPWVTFTWEPRPYPNAVQFRLVAQMVEDGDAYSVEKWVPMEVLELARDLPFMSPWGIFFRLMEQLMTGGRKYG